METPKEANHKRAEDFVVRYANNVYFETSLWDLKLTFGQLDEGAVVQHSAVTIPWAQAKVLMYFLEANLRVHEAKNGRIKLPPGIITPIPETPPADNELLLVYHALLEHQMKFFEENPESAPSKK